MKPTPSIVVVGASEGGLDALRSLVSGLPGTLKAALFVVLHVGTHRSHLPRLLTFNGSLLVAHPRDGDRIHAGNIYIAPPDQHLVVERGHVRLTQGPRENWARPAIDPLFRSAAQAYGSRVIGVILSGRLNDGTAGLYEVKRQGGTTVVQDPDDAVNPGMPRSALAHVAVDHRVPLAGIPALLVRLVAAGAANPNGDAGPAPARRRGAGGKPRDPAAVSCPECGGALLRTGAGSLTQFRCHAGHAYTPAALVAAQSSALASSLGAAVQALSERGELCRQMASTAQAAGHADMATRWDHAMRETRARTAALRRLLDTA